MERKGNAGPAHDTPFSRDLGCARARFSLPQRVSCDMGQQLRLSRLSSLNGDLVYRRRCKSGVTSHPCSDGMVDFRCRWYIYPTTPCRYLIIVLSQSSHLQCRTRSRSRSSCDTLPSFLFPPYHYYRHHEVVSKLCKIKPSPSLRFAVWPGACKSRDQAVGSARWQANACHATRSIADYPGVWAVRS